MAGRRKNRKKRKLTSESSAARKRIFLAFFSLFVIVSMAAVVRYALQRIVIFPVREIKVIGNRHLSDREVRSMARLREGVSIFSVPSGQVVKRLERSPWIKRVYLRKDLPDSIIIRIRESVPSALLEKGRALYLVGRDGTILERQKGEKRFLPVITGDTANRNAVREAVRFAGVLKRYGVDTTKRAEIRVGDMENMTLYYGDTVIKVGYGDYEAKLLRYLELKDEIQRRGIPVRYIDLRYRRRVIVKTSGGVR